MRLIQLDPLDKGSKHTARLTEPTEYNWDVIRNKMGGFSFNNRGDDFLFIIDDKNFIVTISFGHCVPPPQMKTDITNAVPAIFKSSKQDLID